MDYNKVNKEKDAKAYLEVIDRAYKDSNRFYKDFDRVRKDLDRANEAYKKAKEAAFKAGKVSYNELYRAEKESKEALEALFEARSAQVKEALKAQTEKFKELEEVYKELEALKGLEINFEAILKTQKAYIEATGGEALEAYKKEAYYEAEEAYKRVKKFYKALVNEDAIIALEAELEAAGRSHKELEAYIEKEALLAAVRVYNGLKNLRNGLNSLRILTETLEALEEAKTEDK